MLDHFKDYNDIVGDHPSNLMATSLAMNAYMLTHKPRYRNWLLEYVDAWLQRMDDNNGLIPTNIGLDGKIGGATEGKWYGGVYGWGFSVIVPQTGKLAHRSTFQHGFIGFMNAYALTGDDKYLEAWRRQAKIVNSNSKLVNGRRLYPSKYGDQGWYNYTPAPFAPAAMATYYLSMKAQDRERVASNAWLQYLAGNNPGFPEQALRADFARVRQRHQGMLSDTTTPDTRLADDPMKYNPCSVSSLIQLMLGGIHPGHLGSILHCRLRYFDPVERRAGVPADVAALVDRLTADEVAVTLVNTSQVNSRTVVVQAGGYGEHQFVDVTHDQQTRPVNARQLTVRLAPGCGNRLVFRMKRFVNAPTLALPWNRAD